MYSCVNSCEINVDEFVVVQESADGNPQKRELKKVEPGETVYQRIVLNEEKESQ